MPLLVHRGVHVGPRVGEQLDGPLLQAEPELHHHHVFVRHHVGVVGQELEELLFQGAYVVGILGGNSIGF